MNAMNINTFRRIGNFLYIQVYIHGQGEAKRNFLYVEDCVNAMMTILRRGVAGQIYNIGGDIEEYASTSVGNVK